MCIHTYTTSYHTHLFRVVGSGSSAPSSPGVLGTVFTSSEMSQDGMYILLYVCTSVCIYMVNFVYVWLY